MKIKKILPFGKSIFHNLKNYWIFWVFKWFIKNKKSNSKIKWLNNSCFVTLIFAILLFRNIGRSRIHRSKFWLPPRKIKTPIFFYLHRTVQSIFLNFFWLFFAVVLFDKQYKKKKIIHTEPKAILIFLKNTFEEYNKKRPVIKLLAAQNDLKKKKICFVVF